MPVIGNQQPGGIVERAVRDILSLPPALQPSQVITLLDLSGPCSGCPTTAITSTSATNHGNRQKDDGTTVCADCLVADSARARSKGLLGRASLGEDEGILLRPGSSIHMFFMRFAIDAVFLDRELRVLRVAADLKPGGSRRSAVPRRCSSYPRGAALGWPGRRRPARLDYSRRLRRAQRLRQLGPWRRPCRPRA